MSCTISSSLLLGLSCLLLCFLQTRANAAHLVKDATLCQTLNVGHLPNNGGNVEDVSIKLVTADGVQKECYSPNTIYDCTLLSMRIHLLDRVHCMNNLPFLFLLQWSLRALVNLSEGYFCYKTQIRSTGNILTCRQGLDCKTA